MSVFKPSKHREIIAKIVFEYAYEAGIGVDEVEKTLENIIHEIKYKKESCEYIGLTDFL